ncbi:10272_t:CDS:2, partial [Acaulospora morrowiae]
ESIDIYDEVFNETSTEKAKEPVFEEFIYPYSPGEDDMTLVESILTSEKLTRFYNKLHLLRSDFKYISLDGEDGCPPTKPNGFLLSNIPASCNQLNLYTIFGVFGHIFFQWIDDTNCWLIVKDDKKVNKVPQGVLGQTKLFSLFLEGGKNYDLALEKGITKEMGEICIQSWRNWVKSILYAESEEKSDAEERQNDDAASIDVNELDVKVEENGFDSDQVKVEFGISNSFPAPHDEPAPSWDYPKGDNFVSEEVNIEWLRKEENTYNTNYENGDGNLKDEEEKQDGWDVISSETLNTSAKRTLSTPQPPVEEEESDSEMNGAFKKTKIG